MAFEASRQELDPRLSRPKQLIHPPPLRCKAPSLPTTSLGHSWLLAMTKGPIYGVGFPSLFNGKDPPAVSQPGMPHRQQTHVEGSTLLREGNQPPEMLSQEIKTD